jgi:dihydroorotate dehydrogenase (NAD+) catalytic subunit
MSGFQLAGHELESPLVNAAGSINGVSVEGILREVNDLTQTGIGAITVGSFTVPPQAGNEARFGAPVYYYDAETRTTYNSMGLPNIGIEAAVRVSPALTARAHERGKIVIYSGSPTHAPEHGNSIDQAARLAYDLLETDADLVEVNVSCPNIVTSSNSGTPILGYDLESMEALLTRLEAEVGNTGRLGLKLPPYLSTEGRLLVPQLAALIQRRHVFRFLVTSNTIPNQIPHHAGGRPILAVPEGKGGMSGPSTKEVGREQLVLWRQHTDLDMISTLGVDSGKELNHRLHLGANAAGGVTFLWQSTNWKATITKMLIELAEEQ